LCARDALEINSVWKTIQKLDGKIPSNKQYAMYVDTANLLKHATRWMLQVVNEKTNIQNVIDNFQEAVKKLYTQIPKVLSKDQKKAYTQLRTEYLKLGLNARMAKRIASTRFMQPALDIVSIASQQKSNVIDVASTYYKISDTLDLNWLHVNIIKLQAHGRWQAMARNSLREQTYLLHKEITNKVLSQKRKSANTPLELWKEKYAKHIKYLASMLESMQDSGTIDFSTVTVVIQEMNKFLD